MEARECASGLSPLSRYRMPRRIASVGRSSLDDMMMVNPTNDTGSPTAVPVSINCAINAARPSQNPYLLTRTLFHVSSFRNEWLRVFVSGRCSAQYSFNVVDESGLFEREEGKKKSGNCLCYWEENARKVNSQVRLDTGFPLAGRGAGRGFVPGLFAPSIPPFPFRGYLRP